MENNKTNFFTFKSIKIRLIFVVTLIVITIISGISVIIYNQNIQKIEKLMGERAQSIASTGATMIDGDDHEKITQNLLEAGKMKEWKSLQKALARIKEKNFLEEDVYTMMDAYWVEKSKENPFGMVFFTALAKSKEFTPKGQPKESYVNDSFTKKVSGFTPIFQTINGFFITGYAPILTSKGIVTGVLEVALEVGKEIKAARLDLIKSISTAALIGLLVAVFLVVIASQKISSPIKALTLVVQDMAKGNLQARMKNIRTQDEVAILGHGFNEMAGNLEKSYRELEKYSEHLEEMVAERTAELAAANARITAMLDNMKLSVFSVDNQGKIDGPVSAYSSEVFNQDILSKDVFDVVYKDVDKSDETFSKINSSFITVYGEDEFQWDLMQDELPREINLTDQDGSQQYLEIKYSPLWDEEELLDQILMVVDDVTELKRLEKEAARIREESDKQNKILTQLSNIGTEALESNFRDFREIISKIMLNVSSGKVGDTFILLHTIKGNTRVLGLDMIAAKIHEIEVGSYHLKGQEEFDATFAKSFEKSMDELKVVISSYNEIASSIFKVKRYFSFPDPDQFIDYVLRFDAGKSELKEVLELTLDQKISNDDNLLDSILDDPVHSQYFNISNFSDQFINNVLSQIKSVLEEDDSFDRRSTLSGVSKSFFDLIPDVIKKGKNQDVIKDLENIETVLFALVKMSGKDVSKFEFNSIKSSDENVEAIISLLELSAEYSIDYKLDYNKKEPVSVRFLSTDLPSAFPKSLMNKDEQLYISFFNMFIVSLFLQHKEELVFKEDPKTFTINENWLEHILESDVVKKDDLHELKRFPLSFYTKRYIPIINEISKNNQIRVRVDINQNSVPISEKEFQFVDKYLSQLLVNSVEHGLENTDERKKVNKSEIAKIEITLKRQENKLMLEYSDDGSGIDYDKIKEKMPDKTEDKFQIFEYLLKNPVSTADGQGLFSGMGEGLSIIGKDYFEGRIGLNFFPKDVGFHLNIQQK